MQLDIHVEKRQGEFDFQANFHLDGNRIGLFGPSGSGKSTLMHLLAGLRKPDSGSICLNDTVLFDSASKVNLPPDKRRVGVVFQHSHLFPHMSVRKNLFYGLKRTPERERQIDADAIIEVLNLEPLLDRGVNLLSGGERQRVALGRTVLTCPRLILMDEPLTGLDEDLKFQIIPYLTRVFSQFNIPLVFISHSLVEMRLMTEQVLLVEEGCVEKSMTSEALAQKIWGASRQGYANLITLGRPRAHGDLWAYTWGEQELILTECGENEENVFELDAREILLFKRHPEATSARNLLPCTVRKMFTVGNRVRLELGSGSETLIAQIVPESVRELEIEEGREVVAVIKASAFSRLL
ncbi:molybdenum ABC transporter ATP-binding protein [Desulfobulbus rhabdoformis]|uniref:molybdenum ABC transporter ATP-binding protein n=1 Tax=Desulfobulbus rhabdoformis TaxID=34032 RepID=UPI001964B859|nr:molybdenum ABC transporter ATP-binding protein [Desulfobulbus rhabdoformis]MBM9614083.1 molybdenum ABC transporter ATP-binding protein [Desulfobulbus rhabdoformis]